jgi:WD40 repeat protein
MKGQPKVYAKIPSVDYNQYEHSYNRQETMPDHSYNKQGPLITQNGPNSTMAEYLSSIPDPTARAFVSELSRKKISETHSFIDWVCKALHHYGNNCSGFLEKLNSHLSSTNKMIDALSCQFLAST